MQLCTLTRSEPFSLILCLDATKFVLLSVFTLTETIWPKTCSQLRFKNAKSPLRRFAWIRYIWLYESNEAWTMPGLVFFRGLNSVAFLRLLTLLFLLQIANAARYGAIAALLFSDPADYARAGPDPKDTYPNTAWLPASGVQRGSLYTFPGSGDPQTPAIAALPGMWRRPQNESELPPIPAHPMGYGDAIYFLSKMGGTLCQWKL